MNETPRKPVRALVFGSPLTRDQGPVREAVGRLPEGSRIYHQGSRVRGTSLGWEYVLSNGYPSEVPIGADAMAHDAALGAGLDIEIIGQLRTGELPRILDSLRPDVVLAFPCPRSRGTWELVKIARENGFEVIVHRCDDMIGVNP
jgi:hypothetical protein